MKWLIAVVLAALLVTPIAAQDTPTGVRLEVRAGFAGLYRDVDWTPVTVDIANDGPAVEGRLVIRPQTTDGVLHTVSSPVTLADGARQTVTLYTTLRGGARAVRVELLAADSDTVLASSDAGLRQAGLEETVAVVVTTSAVGSIDLTGATLSALLQQGNMALRDLPDRAEMLRAVDVIALSDVDTSPLTEGQRAAIAGWVAQGGHLIVTGGVNGALTADGVADLLPLRPQSVAADGQVDGLAAWLRGGAAPDASDGLTGTTALVTGDLDLMNGARVLARDGDGRPLIARRDYGDGTVDLLTFDPNAAPLRGWSGLSAMWSALLTSVEPLPTWGGGFFNWNDAASAAAIVPGYDPFPDILPLLGFLGLYIALIGPINYIALARIGRREWAWITIPVTIVVFSVLAYIIGSGWRGNTMVVTQLSVVRTWPDVRTAQVDTLFGLLSPQRAAHTLTLDAPMVERASLRPMPIVFDPSSRILVRPVSENVTIDQRADFRATEFTIDSSFVAPFTASGQMLAPIISSQFTLVQDEPTVDAVQTIRATVRNESDLTLTEPVILMRGAAYELGAPLAPRDTVRFTLDLPGALLAAPARRLSDSSGTYLFGRRYNQARGRQTIVDILTPAAYQPTLLPFVNAEDVTMMANYRRQQLLSGLIVDAFGADGRGDRAYLAAWHNASPIALTPDQDEVVPDALTLYLIELNAVADNSAEPNTRAVITPDRFTWTRVESNTFSAVTPASVWLEGDQSAALRFTPLPDARLLTVTALTIEIDRSNYNPRTLDVQVWNWRTGAWEAVQIIGDSTPVRSPDRFIGPENAVMVRFAAGDRGGLLQLEGIGLTMTGTH